MSLSPDVCKKMYTTMWRIRLFEEEADRQTNLGNVVGTLHMYCGEEAVAVGVCSQLRSDDYVLGTHRSHGHCLAKGADSSAMMAELFGKATGTCGGKGGSMHVADFSLNMLGANGIVGAGIGPTTGTALASKLRKSDQASVCFFGDGAAARGTFHEAIMMGSLWKLPVVYVCENNQYQQWVPRKNVAVIDSVADMAASYAIPGVSINGQDALEVYEVAGEAVARARRGEGPTLIEARTYRFYGHSLGDEQQYRTSDEVEKWKTDSDPIKILGTTMKDRDWLTDEEDENIQQQATAEIKQAVEFAEQSPWPTAADLETDVTSHSVGASS